MTPQEKFDVAWDKQWFVDKGILTGLTAKLEFKTDYAVPVITQGTIALSDGCLRATGGVEGVCYWDLGALFSKVLIVLCGKDPNPTDFGFGADPAVPTNGHHGYAWYNEVGNIAKDFVNLGGSSEAPVASPDHRNGQALFLDGTAHIQKWYGRNGAGRWYFGGAAADAAYASFRYIFLDQDAAPVRYQLPFVVYGAP